MQALFPFFATFSYPFARDLFVVGVQNPPKRRGEVTRDRLRYNDGEYDLDLSYITDRIIAMGFPASGMEATYRNNIKEVSEMLLKRHGKNFMVFNVSERTYDTTYFNDQVQLMGWPDHHAPNLCHLFNVVTVIHRWLKADAGHVAVIHCMAGKGRTGTVISALLVYDALFDSAEASMKFFGKKRSQLALGVQQPSQVRYVRYFSEVVLDEWYPSPLMRYMNRLEISPVPNVSHHKGIRPRIQVFNISSGYADKILLLDTVWDLAEDSTSRLYKTDFHTSITLEQLLPCKGDILIRCYHVYSRLGRQQQDCIFRFSFNTAFIRDRCVLQLWKHDLDLAHTDRRLPDSLSVSLHFEPITTDEAEVSQIYSQWPPTTHEQFLKEAATNKEVVDQMGRLLEQSIASMRVYRPEGIDDETVSDASESEEVLAVAGDAGFRTDALGGAGSPPPSRPVRSDKADQRSAGGLELPALSELVGTANINMTGFAGEESVIGSEDKIPTPRRKDVEDDRPPTPKRSDLLASGAGDEG